MKSRNSFSSLIDVNVIKMNLIRTFNKLLYIEIFLKYAVLLKNTLEFNKWKKVKLKKMRKKTSPKIFK